MQTYVVRVYQPDGQAVDQPELRGVVDEVASSASVTVSAGDPVVAVSASGDAVAVWVWSAPTGDSVQVSDHPAGGGWGEPMTLAEAPRVGDPQVAVDANGDTFVAWSQGPDGSHSQVRAADRPLGGIWQTTPQAFGDTSQVSGSERLAVDRNGDEALVWIATDPSAGTSVPYATNRPAGGSWLTPLRLSGSAAQPQTGFPPAVAMDPPMLAAPAFFNPCASTAS